MKPSKNNPSGLGRAARALVAVSPRLLMAVWWVVMLAMLVPVFCRRAAIAARECWTEARFARAAMLASVDVERYTADLAKVIRKGEPS